MRSSDGTGRVLAIVVAVSQWRCSRARRPSREAVNNITPVYEGWLPNPDGSFELLFGYLNREWDEEVSHPARPGQQHAIRAARISASRRTSFLAATASCSQVHVPKDFGKKEIVWTLTSKGRTDKAYGTLKPDYVLDDTVIMSNIGAGGALSTSPDMVGNKAPVLNVEGPKSRTAKVGRARSRSPRSRPTMGSRTGGTCRRVLGGNYSLPPVGERPAAVVLRLSRQPGRP